MHKKTTVTKKNKPMIGIWSELLKIIFLAGVTWIIMNTFLINSLVPSESMDPTIKSGSCIIGLRTAYKNKSLPARGDIVIFRFPDDERTYFIKRVIGIPGDMIEIIPDDNLSNDSCTGNLYINGKQKEEKYLREEMCVSNYMKFQVPKDSYFCMGDNRNNSFDSRFWNHSFVHKDKIVAKVVFQYSKSFKTFNVK